MNGLTIDRLLPIEQELAADILLRCFGPDMRESAIRDIQATFADHPYAPCSLIGKFEGRCVGFVQVLPAYFWIDTFAIAWLGTVPEFRRQGVGSELMRSAEKLIVRERLKGQDGTFILAASDAAFYAKLGYNAGILAHDGAPFMVKYARSLIADR